MSAEELAARAGGAFPLAAPMGPGRRNAAPQDFAIGESVRVKQEFTPGHTRMPGYIRGKSGIVVGKSPPYPFPDAAAHGLEAAWEPTYDVRFRSADPVARLVGPTRSSMSACSRAIWKKLVEY